MGMFDFLRTVVATEDGNVLFMLALIVVMELFDVVMGTLGAKVNPKLELSSRVGLNGLFRKVYGIALMVLVIPLSILLPDGVGQVFIYGVYTTYIVFLVQSLVENYEKIAGEEVKAFTTLTSKLKELLQGEKDNQ